MKTEKQKTEETKREQFLSEMKKNFGQFNQVINLN